MSIDVQCPDCGWEMSQLELNQHTCEVADVIVEAKRLRAQRDRYAEALKTIASEASSSAVVEDDDTAEQWFRTIEDIARAALAEGEGT